ncbi:unnamed protein product [Brassicogethes aeneus]|uniref:Uncharacterized protein n=1 Tax=Brassicogethes aeneus TaxID=1431903 RepID=A0A9P0AWR2_BRAAE|nr:unnamed protein product [Brassicogethes aeneus]
MDLVWASLIRNTRKSSVVEDNTHQPKTLKTLCREVINAKINTCEVFEAKLSETVVNEVFQNRVQDFAMSFDLDDSVLFRNIFGPITDFWGEEALRRFWGFRSDGVMIESIFGSLLPAAEQFCVTDNFYHTTYGRVCEQCVQQNCLKRAGIESLIIHGMRGFDDNDRVGMVFTNAEFPDRPLAISLRKRSQLTTTVILNTLGIVLQSNSSFFTNNELTLSIDRVQIPARRRRVSLKGATFVEFCRKKHGIVIINNDDNYCLAYALELGIAYRSDITDFKNL